MNKYEFLYRLNRALESSTDQDRKDIAKYYDELIQDAIDNGENEADFIDKLGSIDKIVRTIRADRGFVTNVKQKKDYQLQNVFSVTVKILGYLLLAFLVITLGSIAVSLLGSGAGMAVYGIVKLIFAANTTVTAGQVFLSAGLIAIGTGLFLAGIWIFGWLLKESKNYLEKLMEYISGKLSKKEGE